jgi:hypothetical protein
VAGDNAVLFVDQHRVGEAKFADRGGDLRDLPRLAARVPVDQLELQRLKKRKLLLKDQITKIESELLPDIIA